MIQSQTCPVNKHSESSTLTKSAGLAGTGKNQRKGSQIINADELLTTKQISERTQLSESFYAKKRLDGEGPRYLKLSRSVRYRWADVQAWLKSRGRASTSEY